MRRAVFLGTAAFALVLASCATTYQPLDASGGYRDYKTAQDRYVVSFNGNGYTSPEDVYQFFLTRAAQIARDNGYRSFYVVQGEDSSTSQIYWTPGVARTTDYVDVYRRWVRSRYGNVGFLDTTVTHTLVTTYGPPVYYQVDKPGYRGQILLVNQPMPNQALPFDADQVYKDGMELKDRIDAQNRQAEAAGAAAAAFAVVIAVLYG